MSRPSAFVLPEHAEVTVGTTSFAVRHEGDVVLEQTLGRQLSLLEAGGDVTLREARFHGSVRAGGTVRLEADFDGEDLRGEVVEIGAVSVHARVIVARSRVVVGRASLAVDVIIAPEVHIDPAATGRVRVVDCLNDRPPTKVRGCLSLEDYEADFGDVAGFLARHDVRPVSPLPAPLDDEDDEDGLEETAQLPAVRGFASVAPPEALPAEEVPAEEIVDDAVVVVTGAYQALDDPDDQASTPTFVDELPESHVELVDDLDVGEVSVTTYEEGAPPEVVRAVTGPSRVARQVERAWERMAEAYVDGLPEGVAHIGALVRGGRAEEVPERADDLWVATLREHLVRGVPPPPGVVLAFHALRAARTAA